MQYLRAKPNRRRGAEIIRSHGEQLETYLAEAVRAANRSTVNREPIPERLTITQRLKRILLGM